MSAAGCWDPRAECRRMYVERVIVAEKYLRADQCGDRLRVELRLIDKFVAEAEVSENDAGGVHVARAYKIWRALRGKY